MKHGVQKFFNRKSRIFRVVLSIALVVFAVSTIILAVTNKKNPYALTSFASKDHSYELSLDPCANDDSRRDQKTITVNQELLRQCLTEIGATSKKPLVIFIKLIDDVISTDKLAWLQALKQNINYVSNNLMDLDWESKNGTSVSTSAWKVDGNAPAGYFSWSPDYNGPGTWFEPYFLLKKDGTSDSSSWNAWPSLYKRFWIMSKESQTQKQEGLGGLLKVLCNQDNHVLTNPNQWPKEPPKDEWGWRKASQNVFQGDGALRLNQVIGSWTNDSNHAECLEQFIDDQMAFIPMSQNQYMTTTSLRKPWLNPRNSPLSGVNYRDYGITGDAIHNNLKLATAIRIFDSVKTPLNPCFQDWPLFNNFDSFLGTLLTWVTSGDVSGIDKDKKVIQPSLYLQTATSVTLYDKNNELLDSEKNSNPIRRGVPIDLTDKMFTKATRYEFEIDSKLRWVDSNGTPKDLLSPQDFKRGLEAYWLSSECGLNLNGYYFNMIGLDVKRTLEDGQSLGTKFNLNDILNPNYDITQKQNVNTPKQKAEKENTFNFYLTKPYPLFLDALSKESFSPLPSNNPKVKNIATSQQTINKHTKEKGKIFLDQDNQIDNFKTNFNQIFGSGSNFKDMLNNFWSIGPYAINQINNNEIVFVKNEPSGYWDINKDLRSDEQTKPWPKANEKPIDRVLLYYGGGDESIFYEKFLANQLDYVPLESMSKILAAGTNNTLKNCLLNFTPAKTSTGIYLVYTGQPYRYENGTYIKQSNLTDAFYKLMEWWNDDKLTNLTAKLKPGEQTESDTIRLTRSDVSKIIRSIFFGFVNFAQLARLQNSSGSFQYSLIPYGAMNINDKTTGPTEFYHYIDAHPEKKPGAMLNRLEDYLGAIAPNSNNNYMDLAKTEIRVKKRN